MNDDDVLDTSDMFKDNDDVCDDSVDDEALDFSAAELNSIADLYHRDHTLADLVFWTMRDGTTIKVTDMRRTHVQHAMLWCQRRIGQKDWEGCLAHKDGFTYEEWSNILLVRLLTPACE